MRTKTSILCLFFATNAFAGLVQPLPAAPAILIPVAGSTAGAGGTFFRSDVTIFNASTRQQVISLQWLPQGVSGVAIAPVVITLSQASGFRSPDFVHDHLNTSGLGSIIVTGINSDGSPDPSAALFVTTRIWSQVPGSTGTTSQTVPAIPLPGASARSAEVFGVNSPVRVNGTDFRVNIGIVNLDPASAHTFLIESSAFTGAPWTPVPVTVPAMSMQQVPLLNPNTGPLGSFVITKRTPGNTAWTAYGSTIDNVSGGAWTDLAFTTP